MIWQKLCCALIDKNIFDVFSVFLITVTLRRKTHDWAAAEVIGEWEKYEQNKCWTTVCGNANVRDRKSGYVSYLNSTGMRSMMTNMYDRWMIHAVDSLEMCFMILHRKCYGCSWSQVDFYDDKIRFFVIFMKHKQLQSRKCWNVCCCLEFMATINLFWP